MDYSKYYTPPKLAEFLVNHIRLTEPKEIIDICCGSCNLLHAASQKWPKAKLVGVDILSHQNIDIEFVKDDGRKFAIEHPSSFSLVLANPPFDIVSEKNSFPLLYENAPSNYSTARLEIEMLLANLRILKDEGTLVIIMPSTFVNAERHKTIRCYLAQKYYVQKIMWLPDNVFGTSMISCCALVIKKIGVQRKRTQRIVVQFSEGRFFSSEYSYVSNKCMLEGRWEDKTSKDVLINATYRRGNISSQHFVEKGIPVLHTSKYQLPWSPSIRYISEPKPNAVYVERGDILISRVGKSAGQWCKYNGERAMISDCLYVLKDPKGDFAQIMSGKNYSFPVKGVATRYITMKDFCAWIETLSLK